MTALPVALQLYTVREETARDFAGTIHQVAAIGYAGVEFADYGGLAPEAVCALLDETGLQAAGAHVSLDVVENGMAHAAQDAATVGLPYLALAWLPEERRTPRALHDLAPRLNEAGRVCREHGICFGYHNHDFEFRRADDRYLLDILLDATDPDLVALELDVYWAAFAGVDPVAYIRQRPGRIPLVHLKDLAADRSFADVGDGTLDIHAIAAAALQDGGAAWYIVEHDRPPAGGLVSARRSLENLRAMGLAGA